MPVATVVLALITVAVPLWWGPLFGVRFTYTVAIVALGGATLGALAGVTGTFAVLRRQSLLGDALSHAALPGVAAAFLLAGRSLPALLAGATVASLLGVAFVRLVTSMTRIKEDAAMGIVLAGWFAIGIIGLTAIQGRPDASQAGLDTFILGQAASIVRGDVVLAAVVLCGASVILAVGWRQISVITFDEAFARSIGIRVEVWNGVLATLYVITIVLGLRVAGVVLMVGLLIAPSVAARQWSASLAGTTILAAVTGAAAGSIGAVVSAIGPDVPTGPAIIIAATVLVAVSITFAPDRGLVWVALRHRSNRHRFAVRTALRDVYHYAFDHGGDATPVPHAFLGKVRGRTGRRALRRLLARRLVERIESGDGVSWRLTPAGIDLARADAANQTLWDAYRDHGIRLGMPLIEEERERDIRAVLPEPTVAELRELVQARAERPEEPHVRD